MRVIIRYFLDRLPYIGKLRQQIRDIGRYPAGHYSSPIPKHDDILVYLQSRKIQQRANSTLTEDNNIELPDIHLNKESQFEILQEFKNFYNDLPFHEQPHNGLRYYYDQGYFCYADAIFLYSFLRHTKPKRVIEIGSGFSSAVILDTADFFLNHHPEITFVEPYPDRLINILKPQDKEIVKIIERKVQEVPIETFTSLQPGDLLFIDSSHVIKCGNDMHFLMFDILPRIPVGVFVHFHDIFYPFEYPAEWLLTGRYWNEDYFLRAFLAYNSEWKVYFFNTYVAAIFKKFIAEYMPLCLKNTGGSIYIQRTGNG